MQTIDVAVARVRRVRPGRGANRSTRSGYILVATSISLIFLLGICGLAIDIGRMYVTKNEAQAYVDAASLAAARQLDGTTAGITRAQAAVSTDTDKWRFETSPFTSVSTSFSDSATGTFTTSPLDPTNYKYARVTVSVNLPMFLIRPLSGPSATIAATAVSGNQALTTIPSGVFPFSPYTRINSPDPDPANPGDPYGFKIGNQYTLRWGAPGDRTSCGTDATSANLSQNGSVRGYCCVSNSAADLRQAIVGGQTDSITIGQYVPMDNGAKNAEMSAIAMRVEIDSDTTSSTYAAYRSSGTGNGARVVVVPVNGGPPNYPALGFAGFFLLNDNSYTGLKGNDSACGEYIGAWTEGVTTPPPSGSGAYHLRLFK